MEICALSLKCEIFLHQKAEYRSDDGCEHFRWCRVEMAYFYENFQANVVEEYAHSDYEKVSDELRPSSHF